MLEIRNLEYEILRDKIIQDFSLNLEYKKLVCLFGASGCGKTTLLRVISGLEKPTKGKIVNKFNKISYLFQEDRLILSLNALQNVLLCMPNPDESKALEFLAKVGLNEKDVAKYPRQLSGGMAKRVSFVRAMLSGGDLMLLDEPFSGLDNDMRTILMGMINDRLNQASAILVTHDRFEAAQLADEILFLSKKGLLIEKRVKLDVKRHKRDSIYINEILNTKFGERVYFD